MISPSSTFCLLFISVIKNLSPTFITGIGWKIVCSSSGNGVDVRVGSGVSVGDLITASVVVGEDFRFGRGQEGDLGTLMALGDELGFEVEVTAESFTIPGLCKVIEKYYSK